MRTINITVRIGERISNRIRWDARSNLGESLMIRLVNELITSTATQPEVNETLFSVIVRDGDERLILKGKGGSTEMSAILGDKKWITRTISERYETVRQFIGYKLDSNGYKTTSSEK